MSRAVIISTTWVCAVWFTVVGVGYAIAGDWALVAPYLCAATGWVSAAVAKTRLEQVRRLHTADEFGAWCCHCASTCAPSGVRH